MANLPIIGGSSNTWGTELNDFLTVSHEPSGSNGGDLKTTALDGINFTGTISLSAATEVGLPANTFIGTVSATEIGYLDGVTSAVQTQINTHTSATSAHGTTTDVVGVGDTQTLTNKTLTLPKVNSTTTITVSGEEINYVAGVTSNIQTQLNSKSATTHTHVLTGGATDVTASAAEINQALDGIGGTVTYITLTTLTSGGAADGYHTHVISDISNITANSTEINQVNDGVGTSVTAITLTDLTSGGYDASSYHYHSTDRARANHTGTQAPVTISPQGSGSGLDSDKLRGKAWVLTTSGSGTITADGSGSFALETAGQHNQYMFSVYTTSGDIYQTGAINDPSGDAFIPSVYAFIKRPFSGTDSLVIHNHTAANEDVFYEVYAWKSV